MREIKWMPILGWENYEVSETGIVRRIKSDGKPGTGNYPREQHELRQRPNNNGYMLVDLWKNGKRKQFLVHRLVAMAFIPNPLLLPCVNHKDENPRNNSAENLEWCTHLYNMNYGNHPKRISMANSKPVIQITRYGAVVKIYPSIIRAEQETKISNGSIGDVLHGRRKTAGGYLWSYMK